MESSAEALKMAFAIFMFIVAISTTLYVLGQSKTAADTVFYYADKTNFQNKYNGVENIVGVDEVIATLFRYYKESISVTIKDRDNNIIAIFDTALEKDCPWNVDNDAKIARVEEFITENDGENSTGVIANFDFDDENNYKNDSRFGKILKSRPDGTYVNATTTLPNLVGDMQNARFRETMVEIASDGIYHTPSQYALNGNENHMVDGGEVPLEDDGTTIQITPATKKVYITYVLQ